MMPSRRNVTVTLAHPVDTLQQQEFKGTTADKEHTGQGANDMQAVAEAASRWQLGLSPPSQLGITVMQSQE